MPSLAKARAALDRGEFQLALELVGDADRCEEALEVRAAAAHGAGCFEKALTAWEHLYAVRLEAGRDAEAAFVAATIALQLLCDTALMAPVRGWVVRAERLVGEQPLTPTHALLAGARTYERFLCGDPEGAREHALLAAELGESLGVDVATGLGRMALARLAIHDGLVAEGIELLDELALWLASGTVEAYPTGMLYCELICAALAVGRLDRAREWTEVMERWRHGRAYGALHGRCRVHRAELLRISGPAADAEREALDACAELRPWMRREFGWPLAELGNIRLRRGDLDGAEEAYLRAHEHAWTPQPGLALLRLERGDVAAASEMIADAIEHPGDVPWKERPPFGELRRAPLLDAQVEIACAAGDVDTARAAAQALEAIAVRHRSPALDAAAALARARGALLEGDPEQAVTAAATAVSGWFELEAPYDAAAARVVLGRAHLSAGRRERARMEWEAARAAFARFGAARREAAVVVLLESLAAPEQAASDPATPAAGETVVLHRAGDHWRLRFRGADHVLPDLKGLRYLERLVAEPGREFHVLDLVTAESVAAGIPVLDEEAKAAYRRRLAEVDEDLAAAEADNDLARVALAERDRQYLMTELGRAVGLGGRSRTTGGTVERARTSVTRSLRYALGRLAEQAPDLGAHLAGTVRTGSYCWYRPDPVSALTWRLGPDGD
ncbi:MAG TPA: hypothetical protein VD859_01115 [Nocardioides sp.]|nr:hypothetical protein [Nocardioides sp.]